MGMSGQRGVVRILFRCPTIIVRRSGDMSTAMFTGIGVFTLFPMQFGSATATSLEILDSPHEVVVREVSSAHRVEDCSAVFERPVIVGVRDQMYLLEESI